MRILIHCLTMTGLVTFAASGAAHHSFAAEFSYELFGTIEGKVVEGHYVVVETGSVTKDRKA